MNIHTLSTRNLLIMAIVAMFLFAATQKSAYAVSDEDFKKLMERLRNCHSRIRC